MTREQLIEALATIEHERWAAWQRWVHSQCRPYYRDEGRCLPRELYEQWDRQIATPYAELSEREKQSDREQVARSLPVIIAFVADWLQRMEDERVSDCSTEGLIHRWREEMGA